MDLLVKRIQDEIMKLSWLKPEIRVQNGEWFMEFSLYTNRIARRTEVFELFKQTAKIAEGSYGLVYLPFLSPIIPTIEDKDELC